MTTDSAAVAAIRPGLIWGFDVGRGGASPVDDIELLRTPNGGDGFRWLHFNLADQRTQRWIAACALLPSAVRDLLLSADRHPRVLVEDGVLGAVLQDVERDFDDSEPRVGLIRFALAPSLMVTARLHPLYSPDIVRRRIVTGHPVTDAQAALDLQLLAMIEVVRGLVGQTDEAVQAVEDELLKNGRPFDTRTFITLRALMARLRRTLGGARSVVRRLEDDARFPPDLLAPLVKAAHRWAEVDADLLSLQSQLRLLRDELDLQTTQRTNQNLYILSILTALMMPATLVTGFFGMNTGGLPWLSSPHGTLIAGLLAVGSSAGVYVSLRLMGFIRR
ncbi:MAG TPA: CorA family divalent cation transporter [Caulobacteraceae bacterium]|jgi:Mg2+ and Co2+ transporter CorA|nr:CorA family divalent cation transporter [Caulobacteraceae bacterium]